jgi:hypothetical protein
MSKTEMRASLRMRLLLLAAGILAVLNVVTPATSADTVLAVTRPVHVANAASEASNALGMPLMTTQTPVSMEVRSMLEPARRDPFGLPPPPPPVVAKAPPPAPVAPPTPPAPSAPPLNMTFAGRMTGTDGKQIIYVSFAETSIAIEKGSILPNGYRVENISTDAIEFNYLALNTTATLAIPPAPRFETR